MVVKSFFWMNKIIFLDEKFVEYLEETLDPTTVDTSGLMDPVINL